jgi:hypothetical protein
LNAKQFSSAVHEGEIFPKWAPDSNRGYGSPTFVFYSPLSYYLVSAISLFIPSVAVSMIVAVWFSFLLSGLTMHAAAARVFGKTGSLLAALFYQTFPYHLRDLYVRGSFAELFAFVWFPLIIMFLFEIRKSRNISAVLGLGISYAGLILTHLVSGFIFSVAISLYLIYSLFLKDRKWPVIAGSSVVLGLGLSAFFIVPVFFERQFVQIDTVTRYVFANYRQNFLFSPEKFSGKLLETYLSLHLTVILEAALFFILVLLIRKNRNILSTVTHELFFMISLFLFSLFLVTPLSRPLWEIIPGFYYLQFPWRWIPLMELSLCFLIAHSFSKKEKLGSMLTSSGKRAIIYGLISLSIVSGITIAKGKIIAYKEIEKDLDSEEALFDGYPPTEYAPVWATDIDNLLLEENKEKVTIMSGTAQFKILKWESSERAISINAESQSLLKIATFYYPGWEARIDGVTVPLGKQEATGAILVDVPAGAHSLSLKFIDTPLRYNSKLISLIFVVIVFIVFLIYKKNILRN